MNTYSLRAGEVEKAWYVVNAEGKTLGRLATEIAKVLTGKNKPTFTPHIDMGDFVVVINAEKVRLTGDKLNQKQYKHHTNYPGGLKVVDAKTQLVRHPERVLEHAVKGMLPNNRLRRVRMNKLKVVVGAEHPYAAQKPKELVIA